jgi:hypothetical protein
MTSPPVWPPQNRLIEKSVALGTFREAVPPVNHIGLAQIAPFQNVESDEQIMAYIKNSTQDSLAPARAQDAESELAQKDELGFTTARSRIIDWSLKDTYSASDVMSYTDRLLLLSSLQGQSALTLGNPNVIEGPVAEFQRKLARDDARRRLALDNRLEWLIMTALETGKIGYNDGRVKFGVDYGRPAGYQDQTPAQVMGGATPSGSFWDAGIGDANVDPIGVIDTIVQRVYDEKGVRLTRAFTSTKVLKNLWQNARFTALTGLVGRTALDSPVDMRYLMPTWDQESAINIIQNATGVTFIPYDSVYRSRPIGSAITTNVRYTSDKKVIFLPSDAELAEFDPDGMGFAKTLTSPHPEGDWQSGYYEWENPRRDPWEYDRGNGIKAFPIFFFMDYSFVLQALA